MTMAATRQPEAALSVLPKSDGSATYAYAGYTVTASANGPIEAGRRDENPYAAIVDVVVRPAAGVGGTRERHLESILQSTLQQVILVKNFPRGLIQVVLQVTSAPENEYANTKLVQASLNLPIIPALLQTAVLALLSAAIPMSATATSAFIAVLAAKDGSREFVADPSPRQAEDASSLHVLAFTSHDELLLAESEGDFTMQEWDGVYEAARRLCCGQGQPSRGIEMVLDDGPRDGLDFRHFVRSTVEAKVATDLHWK